MTLRWHKPRLPAGQGKQARMPRDKQAIPPADKSAYGGTGDKDKRKAGRRRRAR